MAKVLGGIELDIITDLTKLPQKQATAMSEIENTELVGANYEPLIYLGIQCVRGVNYWFIAKQTLTTADFEEHIVTIAVNEFGGEYEIVKSTIIRVI